MTIEQALALPYVHTEIGNILDKGYRVNTLSNKQRYDLAMLECALLSAALWSSMEGSTLVVHTMGKESITYKFYKQWDGGDTVVKGWYISTSTIEWSGEFKKVEELATYIYERVKNSTLSTLSFISSHIV